MQKKTNQKIDDFIITDLEFFFLENGIFYSCKTVRQVQIIQKMYAFEIEQEEMLAKNF